MDKYQQNGKIPKNTKVGLTIFGISLVDLLSVFGMAFLGMQIGKSLGFAIGFQVLFIIVMAVTGLLLVIRTPASPKLRNWKVIVNVLKMNRNKYYPITIKKEDEQGVQQKQYRR